MIGAAAVAWLAMKRTANPARFAIALFPLLIVVAMLVK
jgi:hypothetical protein